MGGIPTRSSIRWRACCASVFTVWPLVTKISTITIFCAKICSGKRPPRPAGPDRALVESPSLTKNSPFKSQKKKKKKKKKKTHKTNTKNKTNNTQTHHHPPTPHPT